MGHKKRKDRDKDEESESGSGSSSDSDSSNSEDERHKKREKKDKKEKEKKHKKDKKKHKKHKKHKDKDREKGGKDDSMIRAAKEFLKTQLAAGAAVPAPRAPAAVLEPAKQIPETQRIGEDDYFLKSNEFMAWLQEYRQLLFNELSTDDTRRLFNEDFVKEWNTGRLQTKYYAGLVQAPARRTAHQWGFKGAGAAAPAKGMAAYLEDEKDRKGDLREADRADRRKRAGEQRELLEEMIPRATGRDAIAEKRMARREEAKERGASPDRAFLPGGGDMMGGDDSFAAAKARESRRDELQRNRNLLKREDLTQRVAQAQAKEDDRMAQFRALLNQGPITIAKRQ